LKGVSIKRFSIGSDNLTEGFRATRPHRQHFRFSQQHPAQVFQWFGCLQFAQGKGGHGAHPCVAVIVEPL
jgi:hypothetical protein